MTDPNLDTPRCQWCDEVAALGSDRCRGCREADDAEDRWLDDEPLDRIEVPTEERYDDI